MNADEVTHLIKQMAQQQLNDYRSFAYGHIAAYDPDLHRVKVLIPSFRGTPPAAGEVGTMFLSGWMPLGTPWAGANCGLQVIPLNQSATQDNLTGGDQVLVMLVERTRGVSVTAMMLFNDQELPPAPQLEAPMSPGEAILYHVTGSYLYFEKTGDVAVNSARDINATATRDVNASATRDVNVNGGRNVNITAADSINITAPNINGGASSETLHKIVTDNMVGFFNAHTHPTPDGESSPPSQTMGSGQLTSTLNAG